jgi:hypothetical protein
MPIGQWSIDDLAQREADEIKGNRQLHLRRGRSQLAPNVRQRRQVRIDGQRANRREESKNNRKRERVRPQYHAPQRITG